MSETRADFAVLGSTPLARLVAGLLASAHGRRVVFVGDSQAAFRLPRGIDLSVGPITRPDTWALLAQSVPETLKLLARAGAKGGWSRLDPILLAQTAAGRDGLAHMRSTAAGFGHAIERLPPGTLGPDREGMVVRDAVQLHRPPLEAALDRWLDKLKVTRVAANDTRVSVHPDGSATIQMTGTPVEAARTVLIDDESLIAHLQAGLAAALYAIVPAATVLSEPTAPIAAPAVLRVDTGLTLVQRPNRGVIALGPGSIDAVANRLRALLPAHMPLRRAGQAAYSIVRSHDGAPLTGRIDSAGPVLIAALGPTGAFLAPALARWLADTARPDEAAWFTAHAPGRPRTPSLVADYLAEAGA